MKTRFDGSRLKMSPEEKPFLVALSVSEQMALVDILGEHLRQGDAVTHLFFNGGAPADEPPLTTGDLMQTFLNLNGRAPETPAEELARLQAWQRNAMRRLLHAGTLLEQSHHQNAELLVQIRRLKGE